MESALLPTAARCRDNETGTPITLRDLMEIGVLDGINWAGVVTQALQTGGALVMVLLAWSLPRVAWRGALWWYNSGTDRSDAERAALAQLLEEAEQRGYRRGWSAAEEALSENVARASAATAAQTGTDPGARSA